MRVNEQYPDCLPVLYPGALATAPKPFGSLDAMWLAFQGLATNRAPAVNGSRFFSLPSSTGGSSAPSAPRPAGNGRGQGRTPSQSPTWQTGSRNHPVVLNVTNDSVHNDTWLDTSSNCWPLEANWGGALSPWCCPLLVRRGADRSCPSWGVRKVGWAELVIAINEP